MKKVICSLLIVTILMNFIVTGVSYADGQSQGTESHENSGLRAPATPSNTVATDILEKGEVSQNTDKKKDNKSSAKSETNNAMGGMSMIGTVIGFLGLISDIIPLQIHLILSSVTATSVDKIDPDNPTNTEEVEEYWISIERIIFNKIPILNVNFFDGNITEYAVGTGQYKEMIHVKDNVDDKDPNTSIQKQVTKMYAICQILSIIISLLVLIYIGIKMALSNVASEQAKYKKMIVSWVESVAILFILVYIMIIVINFGEILTNVFYNIKCALENSGEKSFENVIIDEIINSLFKVSGMQLAMYTIMYWILVFTHIKFLFLYMKRMLTVAFLIIIAPLITITYPIDKAGDGKAQAFNAWISEFLINIFIQPVHAIIYVVFMFTAGEIAKYAPILGLVFMMSLGTAEKMLLRLFKKGKSVSIGGINGMKLNK